MSVWTTFVDAILLINKSVSRAALDLGHERLHIIFPLGLQLFNQWGHVNHHTVELERCLELVQAIERQAEGHAIGELGAVVCPWVVQDLARNVGPVLLREAGQLVGCRG